MSGVTAAAAPARRLRRQKYRAILGAAIISLRLVESVCRQFDIETYEVAGSCAVVDIDIKASGVVHRTMLPRPGSDRQVVTRPKRYQAVAHHGA